MRVRRQSSDGDYIFGHGATDFLVDSPEFVEQRVETRLLLMQGEWFLDKTEGTPYSTAILGAHTKPFYDLAIQERVLRTPGALEIRNYQSSQSAARALTVSMVLVTAFGEVPVERVF